MTKILITAWIALAAGMIYVYNHQSAHTSQTAPTQITTLGGFEIDFACSAAH